MVDSYSSSSSMREWSADEAIQEIQNKILKDGRPHLWVANFILENQKVISDLIDRDTFGELSVFTKSAPTPTPIDQVAILKAFLKNTQEQVLHPKYPHIKVITKKLAAYLKDKAILKQVEFFKECCLTLQLKSEENWLTTLPEDDNLARQLKALYTVQILNKMESMLDAIKDEKSSIIYTDLKIFVRNERMKIAYDPSINRKFRLNSLIRTFIRNEINEGIMGLRAFRRSVVTISNSTASQLFNIEHLFKVLFETLRFIFRVVKVAFFPVRFAAMLLMEIGAQFSKVILYLASKCLPQRYLKTMYAESFMKGAIWGGRIGLAVSAYLWIPSAVLFTALGGPLLSSFLNLSFIPKLALAFGMSELCFGVVLGLAKKMSASLFGKKKPSGPDLEQPVSGEVGTVLNSEQRGELCNLLLGKSAALEESFWCTPSVVKEKVSKQDKIETELLKLYQPKVPYRLSVLDKKLLAKRDSLPESFKALEAEIRAVMAKP